MFFQPRTLGDRKNPIRRAKPKRDVIYVGRYCVDPWQIARGSKIDRQTFNDRDAVRFIVGGKEISFYCEYVFGRPVITKTDAEKLKRTLKEHQRNG